MAKSKKATEPKFKLAPLKVKVVEKAVKKGDVPVIKVEGDYCKQYNDTAAVAEDADGLMKALKVAMLPDALAEVFRHNQERPWDAIVSVVLEDEEGKKTRVSFTGSYSSSTVPVVEALFQAIKTKAGEKPNVNDYIARVMEGTFDSDAFLGADGRFDKARYDKIVTALDTVSVELGIKNPLSTVETVKPMKDFHQRRWLDFDSATNLTITKVLQNKVQMVPVAEAAPEEAPEAAGK